MYYTYTLMPVRWKNQINSLPNSNRRHDEYYIPAIKLEGVTEFFVLALACVQTLYSQVCVRVLTVLVSILSLVHSQKLVRESEVAATSPGSIREEKGGGGGGRGGLWKIQRQSTNLLCLSP